MWAMVGKASETVFQPDDAVHDTVIDHTTNIVGEVLVEGIVQGCLGDLVPPPAPFFAPEPAGVSGVEGLFLLGPISNNE